MNQRVSKLLLLLFLSLFITNCAKRGRPTGGKKDSIAPLLVSAEPDHKSINFKAKKVKITFDEYVKLKDINKQLVISPPLKNAPVISPVGTASKFLNIKILDTLKENTTYTFNFGNSIVDNNEENKLEHFKYVVSTGTYIDSLKIQGVVKDAFNQKTDENVSVMLYEITEKYTDSTIFKEKPYYVTSTLDSTNFELSNLKAGKFFLFAVKQPNNSYIYKAKQDKIGFVSDTITLPSDKNFEITLFKEVLPFKLSKPLEATKGKIIFGYEGNAEDLQVKLLDKTPLSFKSELLLEKDSDTLNYWFNGIEKDSLTFEVRNKAFIDTLIVKLRSTKQDTVVFKKDISSYLELRDTFSISSTLPIINVDPSKIKLINQDSISIPFTVQTDAFKTKLYINFEKEVKSKYDLKIFPKSITDIFDNNNDTLAYKFSTKELDNYGTMPLNVSNVKSSVIIELMTDKGQLISSKKITSDQTILYKNLVPATYIIKAIFDENDNGKWDTGNLLLKTHPEKVQYFENEIKVRANWDIDTTFILNSN